MSRRPIRRLCLLLGDQLDRESPEDRQAIREQAILFRKSLSQPTSETRARSCA